MAEGSASTLSRGFPVFIDTNLDTHLAMLVHSQDTVHDLKRKVTIEHALCFPKIGKIAVHALKVRRKASLYHLSDSMCVMSAFGRTKGTCFLHMDVACIGITEDQIGSGGNALTMNGGQQEKSPVLHIEPGGSDLVGDVTNRMECRVINGRPVEGDLVQTATLGDHFPQSLSVPDDDPSSPLVKEKSHMTLQAPSNELFSHFIAEAEVPEDMKFGGKDSCDPGKSLSEPRERTGYDAPEMQELVFEGNGIAESRVQLRIDKSTDQEMMDSGDKKSEHLPDDVDGENVSAVITKKEKSRKRKKIMQSDQVWESLPAEKKRQKKEKNTSLKVHARHSIEVDGAEPCVYSSELGNAPEKERNSEDEQKRNLTVLGEVCTELLNNGSSPRKLATIKKKKRKQSSKPHSEASAADPPHSDAGAAVPPHGEADAPVPLNTDDVNLHLNEKKVNTESGIPELSLENNANNLSAGKNVNKKKSKMSKKPDDSNKRSDGALAIKEVTENVAYGDPARLDSKVPSNGNKKSSINTKKKLAKNALSNHEASDYETVHSSGKQATEENPEKALASDHNDASKESKREIVLEKAADPRVVPEEPLSTNDRTSLHGRKKHVKSKLSNHNSGKNVIVPSSEEHFTEQTLGIDTEDAREKSGKEMNDNKEPGKEMNAASILEVAAALGNSAVPSVTNDGFFHHRKKKSAKTKMSDMALSKHDAMHTSGEQSIQENLEQRLENSCKGSVKESKGEITTEEATFGNNHDVLHFSKSKISEDRLKEALGSTNGISGKESDGAYLPDEVPSQATIRNSAEKTESSEKVSFKEFFVPNAGQHCSVIPEKDLLTIGAGTRNPRHEKSNRGASKSDACSQDGSLDVGIFSSSLDRQHHKKERQHTDSGHNSVDSVKALANRKNQTRKLPKKRSDTRAEKSVMPLSGISPDSGSPKSSQDHQMHRKKSQVTNSNTQLDGTLPKNKKSKTSHHSEQKILEGAENKLKNQSGEKKNNSSSSEALRPEAGDAFATNISVGATVTQYLSGASAEFDPSTKEADTSLVASSDSTEEERPSERKRYRVAVRKVPSKRFRKAMNISNDEEAFLATPDNIFSLGTSAISEDELELDNGKGTRKSISDNSSTSADSDRDLEETQVTDAQKARAYINSPEGGYDKEIVGNGVVKRKSSSDGGKKNMSLGMILRSSSSYRKAKLTVSQSQPEDSESQPVDFVSETQPETPPL